MKLVHPYPFGIMLRLERDDLAWTTGVALRWSESISGDILHGGWVELDDPIRVEGPHPDGVTQTVVEMLRERGFKLAKVARPGQFERGMSVLYL